MKSPAQVSARFADIKPILDQCLQHGGGQYTASTPGAAVQFRHRCYMFRKAYREAVAPNASAYDRLVIRKLAEGETTVRIEPLTASGIFTPASGTPITEGEVAPNDPLLLEALRLREELDLD